MPPALVLALLLLTGADRGGAAASVAFDVRALPAATYHDLEGLALERKVALRLVQEGFAVMAPASGADVEVRASSDRGGVLLQAFLRDALTPSLRGTIAAPEGAIAEWHLEVAHKVSEMARALAAMKASANAQSAAPKAAAVSTSAAAAVTAATTAAPVAAPVTTAVVVRPSAQAPAQSWELGLGGGVLWRAGGSDPLAGLLATHTRGRLRLHLDVLGARSPGQGIDVWEGQALVGLSAVAIEGAAGVDLGLAGGVVAHHFSVDSTWATERAGTRMSPGLWLPLRARWAWGRLVLSARAALGLSRSIEHTRQGAALWSRGSLRLESMLVLSWTL